MMRKVFSFIGIVILFSLGGTQIAHADLTGGGDYCSRANDSAVCTTKSNGDPLAGPNGLLGHINNIVTYAAGAGAIIVIILSGIKYVTSGGDSNRISSAKSTLIYAVIGLVVIVIANLLIRFILGNIAE